MTPLPPVSRVAPCRRFPPSLALVVGGLALLAGCVTVDGVLKADGSGTVDVSYKAPKNSTESIEKRRFSSSQVKLDSFALKPDGMVAAKLSFDDPAKLSSVDLFRNATIKRTRSGEEEKLTVTLTNPTTGNAKEEGKPGPKISVTFPGKVLEAGRNGVIDGSKVTWSISLVDYFNEKSIELMARYQVAAADKAPAADAGKSKPDAAKGKPADGKAAPAKP